MVKNLILANNWKAGCRETCMPGLGRGDWKPAFARRWFPTSPSLMLENNADIRYIKEILGHEDLSSTQIYTHVDIHKLKQVHELTHPAKMYASKTKEVLEELETNKK